MYKKNPSGWKKHIDFIILDLLCLEAAFFLAYFLRHHSFELYQISYYRELAVVMALLNVVTMFLLATMSGVMKRGYFQEFKITLYHVMVVLMMTCVYLYIIKSGESYSRIVIGYTAIFYLLFSYITRLGWRYYLNRYHKSANSQSLMVVTTRKQAARLLEEILKHNYEHYHICSVVYLDEEETDYGVDHKEQAETILNLPVIKGMKAAITYANREWVDEVLFLTNLKTDETAELMSKFRQMGITVHLRMYYSSNLIPEQYIEKLNGMTVLTSSTRYVTQRQLFIKRCMDLAGGLVGSVLAILILLILGPIIKIQSPGPILFKQVRVGRGGKKFTMYKLRSMYLDAEERKAELMKAHADRDTRMFKLEFDPRIIGCKMLPDGSIKKGIGNFIRDYSLDEFPQFFNVLKGDMSLVGTRPPTVDEWEQYELHHRSRLAIKPGITGKWQVSGRSNISDFEEVVKLDQEYIQEWNIGQDIKLILLTVLSVIRKDGAM